MQENTTSPQTNALLYKAVEQNDLYSVKKYIEMGADVSYTPQDSEPNMLELAILNCNYDMVNFFINELSLSNDFEEDAEFVAEENNDEGKKLETDLFFPINKIGYNGFNPICAATCKGCEEIVALLLSRGADPNLPTADGFTALHVASQEGFVEIVELLLGRRDIEVDKKSSKDSTPFHMACHKGHLQIMKLLFISGANINEVYQGGWTSLHGASAQHNREIIRFLLENGANPKIINADGKMAIDYVDPEDVETYRIFEQYDKLKFDSTILEVTGKIRLVHELEEHHSVRNLLKEHRLSFLEFQKKTSSRLSKLEEKQNTLEAEMVRWKIGYDRLNSKIDSISTTTAPISSNETTNKTASIVYHNFNSDTQHQIEALREEFSKQFQEQSRRIHQLEFKNEQLEKQNALLLQEASKKPSSIPALVSSAVFDQIQLVIRDYQETVNSQIVKLNTKIKQITEVQELDNQERDLLRKELITIEQSLDLVKKGGGATDVSVVPFSTPSKFGKSYQSSNFKSPMVSNSPQNSPLQSAIQDHVSSQIRYYDNQNKELLKKNKTMEKRLEKLQDNFESLMKYIEALIQFGKQQPMLAPSSLLVNNSPNSILSQSNSVLRRAQSPIRSPYHY